MSTSEINWQEPPRPAQAKVAAMVVGLKEQPGRWALVYTNTHSSQSTYLKTYGLEVRTVSANKGYAKNRADIYARWPEGETP